MKTVLRHQSVWRAAVAVFAAVATMFAASVASANQGGNQTNISTLNGAHAFVTRNTISSVSGGGGILFVRTQNTAATGLFQVGYHRSTLSGDDCALDGGAVNIFVEWKPAGGSYNCTTYFSGGTGDKFGVVQQSGSSGVWGAYQNGTLLTPTHSVGYNTGYGFVGGEWNGTKPQVSGCFGCGGATAWQYTTNNGGTYTTITSATAFNDGGWTIGAPPSPFTIKNF